MPSSIYFFCEDIQFRLLSVRQIKSWVKKVINAEKKLLGHLNYIFCSDAILSEMNEHYLNHSTLTDIITFDTADQPGVIDGEIYISIDRIRENSSKYKVSFEEELHRVMIHGVLHLMGYKDKTQLQKRAMRKKEHAYLSLKTF